MKSLLPLRTAAIYISAFVAYVAMTQVTKHWGFEGARVQPFQPAAGAVIGVAATARRRHRYLVVVTAIIAGGVLCELLDQQSWRMIASQVTAELIAGTLGIAVGIAILRRNQYRSPGLSVGWFWLSISVAGVASLASGAIQQGGLSWTYWWQNSLALGLGLYAVAPLVLIPSALQVRLSRPMLVVELFSTSLVLAAITVYAFSTTGAAVYLVLPFLFWLCVRGGYRLGLPAALAVGICACIASSKGNGPFAFGDQVPHVQAFLAVVFVSAGILVNFEEVAEVRLARTSALFNAMPDLVVLTDRRGRSVTQNSPPPSLDGVDITGVLERSAGPPRHGSPSVQVRSETVAGRIIEERRLAVGDGTTLSVVRDISDLVAQAEQLARSNDRWRRLSDAAQEGIAEIDSESIIRYANERFAEITETQLDDLIGRDALEVIGAEKWQATATMRDRASKGTAVVQEVGMRTRDGRPRWVLVSLSPQIQGDGSYSGAIVLLTDITDLKAAEIERIDLVDELASVERAAQARLARDLHDGPLQDLTAVHVILGHLANENADTEIITKASSAMTDALAALRSGVRALDPVDVADGGIAEALRRYANRAIGVSEIAVEVDDLSEPPIGAPARVLYRIGREAITNAARHGEPARIDIEVTRTDGGASLRVTDDGQGFTPGGPSVTGQMGIRSMIERARQAGGTCEIMSAPGEGTTVSALLPT